MDNPMVLESELCRFIPEIIRDFEVVGNYQWKCTQWPGIREKGFECLLQDGLGKKYTVNDVISKYISNEATPMEVIANDGGGETPDTHHAAYY